MSENSAAESGYDGDYSDYSVYNSRRASYSADSVQYDDIDYHRDENDSLRVNTEKDAVLREKIAPFNKENKVESAPGLNVPQDANRASSTRNLKQARQTSQQVNNPAEKNSFADLKGVRNLINAWENLAVEEFNGPVHPNGLNPESDTGYESTAGSYLSTMYDSETATLNSIDSNGDDVPRNVSRRMSESSAAESGYDSEGDHNSLASTNELDHDPQVQVDETNHPGVLSDVTGRHPSDIKPQNELFFDLEMDSVDLIDVIIRLEDRGIIIKEKDLTPKLTVSDLIQLRKKESEVLALLCRKYPNPVHHSEFLDEVWGGGYVTSHSIAQVIRSLRKLLKKNGKNIILTIPKLGYRLGIEPQYDEGNEVKIFDFSQENA
uniref:OmpR/PhoB-type domain-containing protein n=1 Tax=Glossina brevipalpis TaxID=37001 RepID=A0A1A9VZ33_9MUSC